MFEFRRVMLHVPERDINLKLTTAWTLSGGVGYIAPSETSLSQA